MYHCKIECHLKIHIGLVTSIEAQAPENVQLYVQIILPREFQSIVGIVTGWHEVYVVNNWPCFVDCN